jgi:hypothetical protein
MLLDCDEVDGREDGVECASRYREEGRTSDRRAR